MSKVVVLGGAAAVTLVVIFLFYRQLSKGTTQTHAEMNHPGLSPVDAAKLDHEEFIRGFYRELIKLRIEMMSSIPDVEKMRVAGERYDNYMIDVNLEITNKQRIIHEDFGVVMLPPSREWDVETMPLEKVDDIVFEWSSMCPKDGIIKQCITDARRERGDYG